MVKKGFEYMNRKIAILFALVLFCVASAGCAQKTAQEETPIVTEMTFDIDGDGEEEACVIDTGPTSGIMSFLLSAKAENTLKYCSMLTVIPDGTPTFVKVGKETRLRLLPLSEEKSVDFSFSVANGELVLTPCGENAAYWRQRGGLPLSARSYIKERHAATPSDQTQQKIKNEEYVITTPYVETTLPGFMVANNTYAHRLEITGRLGGAAKNTTYLVLANREDITFDETWRASGLSSNTDDYFDPKDAVIVGYKLFT